MGKFKHVKVKLIGDDGNAFYILGKVISALKKAGATKEEVADFKKQATSGDYYHLLGVCEDWVTVC